MQGNRLGYFTDEGHIFYINGIKSNMRWKFTEEGHLYYINFMQIYRGQNLQIKEIFFTFNYHGRKIKSSRNFTAKVYLFYLNCMQLNRWQNFTENGQLFYNQPSWYANKQVARIQRQTASFLHSISMKCK